MSNNALISPNELIYSYDGTYLGQRIAQVELDENIFEVASPLYWFPCNNDVVANQFYFDANTKLIFPLPEPEKEVTDSTT
jgi:hypothetical protein